MESDIGATGLRILVTAGGAGAGRVIATHFLDAGAKVVISDVDTTSIVSFSAEWPGSLGIVADASDEQAVENVVAAARTQMGGVDVLVNNVGISGPTALIEDITLDQWNEALRINLTSHFLFARAVIPMMKAQGSGLIVNISSASAKVGLPLRLPYVVSKSAVIAMSMNLARELGPSGIRVNAILPGAIRGERIGRVIRTKADALGLDPADYERSLLRYISLRTMVEPDDIAAMIGFLASPAGSRISGQSIGVDGNLEWEE